MTMDYEMPIGFFRQHQSEISSNLISIHHLSMCITNIFYLIYLFVLCFQNLLRMVHHHTISNFEIHNFLYSLIVC